MRKEIKVSISINTEKFGDENAYGGGDFYGFYGDYSTFDVEDDQ